MLDPKNLKPSTVLEAMINGLLKSKTDPLFTIDMDSYGHIEDGICYGCVASVALADMFGAGQSASELMFAYSLRRAARYTNLSNIIEFSTPMDLEELEMAVDSARKGEVSKLIQFLTGEVNRSFDRFWHLENHNWEQQLPKIRLMITRMVAVGL
jgi:hypothetical protein